MVKPVRDEHGILTMSVYDFLLAPDSLTMLRRTAVNAPERRPPSSGLGIVHGAPVRHIHGRALTNVWLSTDTLPRRRGNGCATLMNRSGVMWSYLGVRIRQSSRKT